MKRLLAVCVCLTAAGACFAAPLTYTASSGTNSASVSFTMVNNSTLQVTLTNTSGVGATSAGDVLTGVYFTTTNTNMTATSATAAGILGCSLCGPNVNVSGEWAFRANVGNVVAGSSAMVLGAADLGIFTAANNISSVNRSGTPNVGGIDYGIVGSRTNSYNFLGTPVVQNTVVFVLNTTSGFNPSSIGTIGFIYNSNGNYSYYSGSYGWTDTPETGTELLTGIGLIGIALVSRKRLRKASAA